MTDINVSWATREDLDTVSKILCDAADWLRARGMPLWDDEELRPDRLVSSGERHRYCLARRGAEAVGTARIQWDDEELWPAATPGEAVYVHRIAIRRAAAGTRVPEALLDFADEVARTRDALYVRLDCDASRTRLCELYSSLGFRDQGDLRIGKHLVRRFQRPVS